MTHAHACARSIFGSRVVAASAIVALALGAVACTSTTDNAATTAVSSPSIQSPGNNAHDEVTDLLVKAKAAYDSPARTSSASNTDKTVDNLQVVSDRLQQAHKIAPYRNDLLFSAASAQIARKDVNTAVSLYAQALDTAPSDVDALSYLAGWSRFLGHTTETDGFMNRIRALDPPRAAELELMFATIDQKVATPLTNTLPDLPSPGLAIVTLGYALNDDGTMNDILIERLKQTQAAAHRWPDAPIIVTGGVEKAGRTEGESMKEWLVDNGVAADRIHAEDFARSTVENAVYAVNILASTRSTQALIISSASHLRRALTIFQLTASGTLGKNFLFTSTGYADKPLTELTTVDANEIRTIYRDSFSSIGMWSYRSSPLLEK